MKKTLLTFLASALASTLMAGSGNPTVPGSSVDKPRCRQLDAPAHELTVQRLGAQPPTVGRMYSVFKQTTIKQSNKS